MTFAEIVRNKRRVFYSLSHCSKAIEPGTHIRIMWGSLKIHRLVGRHAKEMQEFLTYKLESDSKLVIYFNTVVAAEYVEGGDNSKINQSTAKFCRGVMHDILEHHQNEG